MNCETKKIRTDYFSTTTVYFFSEKGYWVVDTDCGLINFKSRNYKEAQEYFELLS